MVGLLNLTVGVSSLVTEMSLQEGVIGFHLPLWPEPMLLRWAWGSGDSISCLLFSHFPSSFDWFLLVVSTFGEMGQKKQTRQTPAWFACLFLTVNSWTGNVTQLVKCFPSMHDTHSNKARISCDIQQNISCGFVIHGETKPGSPVNTRMIHNGTGPRESHKGTNDKLWKKARSSCGCITHWIIYVIRAPEFPMNVCIS